MAFRNRPVKFSTDRKNSVANRFSIQRLSGVTPEKAVFGIFEEVFFVIDTRELIGPRLHDQAV